MTNASSYTIGDLTAETGSQVRGNCPVSVLMYGLGSLAAVEGSILASIVRPMPAT